jgi:hypothetical protein
VGVQIEPQNVGAPGASGSLVRYTADVVVGGMIGGVSQRMLASVGKKMATDFFAAVDDCIVSGGPARAVAPAAGPALATAIVPDTGLAGVTGPASVTGPAVGTGPAVNAASATLASGAVGPDAGVGRPAPGVFSRPAPMAAAATPGGGDFLRGLLAGGVLALLGVIVGGWIARWGNRCCAR